MGGPARGQRGALMNGDTSPAPRPTGLTGSAVVAAGISGDAPQADRIAGPQGTPGLESWMGRRILFLGRIETQAHRAHHVANDADTTQHHGFQYHGHDIPPGVKETRTVGVRATANLTIRLGWLTSELYLDQRKRLNTRLPHLYASRLHFFCRTGKKMNRGKLLLLLTGDRRKRFTRFPKKKPGDPSPWLPGYHPCRRLVL